MKKILILLILPLVICSCEDKKQQGELKFEAINCERKEELMNKHGAILLDVRRPDEYNVEHLELAINVPLDTIAANIEKQVPDKNEKIIVYCYSGKRSAQAAQLLIDMGYKYVFDLGSISNCQ